MSETEQDMGVAFGPGCQPSASAADASSQSGIPNADERIMVGGKSVLRFHPLGRRIRDGLVRCFGCGQIDEPHWHDARFCPLTGGDLPFPTSTLSLTLKADSGYRATLSQRITLKQWVAINAVLSADASAIEAAAAGETRSGSTEGESAAPTGGTPHSCVEGTRP